MQSELTPIKIITVHGTGGGEPGVEKSAKKSKQLKWWQPGSSFLQELGERIDLDPSRVEVVPFKWFQDENGPNSEAKRRKAGHELYDVLRDCEKAGEDYYLIGHSHGGSVIYSALLNSVRHDTHLSRLKGWCTVGTPFLDYRQNYFLFQRLGNFGLSAFASGMIALFLFCLLTIVAIIEYLTIGIHEADLIPIGLALSSLLLFAIACIGLLFLIERRRSSRFSDKHKKSLFSWYGANWLGLWHRDDEAIGALKNIKTVSGPIIPTNFLDPIVNGVQIILMFLFAGWLILGGFLGWDWTRELFVSHLMQPMDQASRGTIGDMIFATLVVSFEFSAFFFVFFIGAFIFRKFAFLIGYPLSKILNKIIWTSVRERAWGDDIIAEQVSEIAFRPPDFETNFYDALPDQIEEALDGYSNRNAVNTLRQVRRALGMRGGPPKNADLKGSLEQSINWSELIHTSYFYVPEFIDLIAIGMSRQGIAKPRPNFDLKQANLAELDEWLENQPNADAVRPRTLKSEEDQLDDEEEDSEPVRKGWFALLKRVRRQRDPLEQ